MRTMPVSFFSYNPASYFVFKFNLTESADEAGIPPLQDSIKLNVPVLLVVAEYVTDVVLSYVEPFSHLDVSTYNCPFVQLEKTVPFECLTLSKLHTGHDVVYALLKNTVFDLPVNLLLLPLAV